MEYEINYDTQAIIPLSNDSSEVIENNEKYIIDSSVMKIMEHSCEYFGSSFSGRKEGTKKLLGISHKSPIIVEESRKIIFFPTTSPDNDECIWVNLEKIENYYKLEKKMSAIKFKNGDILKINISLGSLSNQILRASRLKYILEERIKSKEDNYL